VASAIEQGNETVLNALKSGNPCARRALRISRLVPALLQRPTRTRQRAAVPEWKLPTPLHENEEFEFRARAEQEASARPK